MKRNRRLRLLVLAALLSCYSVRGMSQMSHTPYTFVTRPSSHSETLDDGLRLLSLASVYGLKILGLESRTEWDKMVVAHGASAVGVCVLTEGLKRSIKEQRPDGSDRRSFPSGHTAIAFMGAAMIEKEYGHVSPWITAGGYTLAGATGALRIAHDRHHLNDVLAGAGIGLFCTDIGYWLSDRLFPADKPSVDLRKFEERHSFVGIYTGGKGNVGVEGAWLFDSHWGIGGRAGTAQFISKTEDTGHESSGEIFTALAGGFFMTPIYDQLFAGARLMGGAAVDKDTDKAKPCASGGVTIGIRTREYIDFRINADYLLTSRQDSKKNDESHCRNKGFIITGQVSFRL